MRNRAGARDMERPQTNAKQLKKSGANEIIRFGSINNTSVPNANRHGPLSSLPSKYEADQQVKTVANIPIGKRW